MIKHVIFFKLKENSDENRERIISVLRSMEGRVKCIREIEVGKDVICDPRAYDIILSVTLSDKNALAEYQADPYHADVVKPIAAKAAVACCVVDYEI